MRNRGRKWKRDHRDLFFGGERASWRVSGRQKGWGWSAGPKQSRECRKKQNHKSLSSTDLQWVTERTRAENGSAQIDTFRDVAKY